MEVISWDVVFTELTRRAKSSIQEAFVEGEGEGEWMKLLEA